jgi:hypothetical protein
MTTTPNAFSDLIGDYDPLRAPEPPSSPVPTGKARLVWKATGLECCSMCAARGFFRAPVRLEDGMYSALCSLHSEYHKDLCALLRAANEGSPVPPERAKEIRAQLRKQYRPRFAALRANESLDLELDQRAR